MEYVIGFVFSKSLDRVVMIKKNRPDFLAGKLNGVGGRVDANELPKQAMRRECMEETGLDIIRWTKFHTLKIESNGEIVHCFFAVSNRIDSAETRTDEPVSIHEISSLSSLNTNEPCCDLIDKAVRIAANLNNPNLW